MNKKGVGNWLAWISYPTPNISRIGRQKSFFTPLLWQTGAGKTRIQHGCKHCWHYDQIVSLTVIICIYWETFEVWCFFCSENLYKVWISANLRLKFWFQCGPKGKSRGVLKCDSSLKAHTGFLYVPWIRFSVITSMSAERWNTHQSSWAGSLLRMTEGKREPHTHTHHGVNDLLHSP